MSSITLLEFLYSKFVSKKNSAINRFFPSESFSFQPLIDPLTQSTLKPPVPANSQAEARFTFSDGQFMAGGIIAPSVEIPLPPKPWQFSCGLNSFINGNDGNAALTRWTLATGSAELYLSAVTQNNRYLFSAMSVSTGSNLIEIHAYDLSSNPLPVKFYATIPKDNPVNGMVMKLEAISADQDGIIQMTEQQQAQLGLASIDTSSWITGLVSIRRSNSSIAKHALIKFMIKNAQAPAMTFLPFFTFETPVESFLEPAGSNTVILRLVDFDQRPGMGWFAAIVRSSVVNSLQLYGFEYATRKVVRIKVKDFSESDSVGLAERNQIRLAVDHARAANGNGTYITLLHNDSIQTWQYTAGMLKPVYGSFNMPGKSGSGSTICKDIATYCGWAVLQFESTAPLIEGSFKLKKKDVLLVNYETGKLKDHLMQGREVELSALQSICLNHPSGNNLPMVLPGYIAGGLPGETGSSPFSRFGLR